MIGVTAAGRRRMLYRGVPRVGGVIVDLTVQSVCPGRSVTHGQLPEDPAVVAMVLAELARTPPVVPPSSVCAAG